MSVKEWLIRQRDLKGRIVRICEVMNNKLKSVFIVENTSTPTPVRWNGEEVLENIEISTINSNNRILKC